MVAIGDNTAPVYRFEYDGFTRRTDEDVVDNPEDGVTDELLDEHDLEEFDEHRAIEHLAYLGRDDEECDVLLDGFT